MEFESANPSIVKSIRQRDLLNTWLRLYARDQRLPRIVQYQPERLEDELPDLIYYTVDNNHKPPELIIQSDGARMSMAYGHAGKGRLLEDYVGPRLAPLVMPIYHKCLDCRLPVYTVAEIKDRNGRVVVFERLLMPFSSDEAVTDMIASLKTISEDGGFEINNLMRGSATLPTPKLHAVIDRDLFHRRGSAGDVIEFGSTEETAKETAKKTAKSS